MGAYDNPTYINPRADAAVKANSEFLRSVRENNNALLKTMQMSVARAEKVKAKKKLERKNKEKRDQKIYGDIDKSLFQAEKLAKGLENLKDLEGEDKFQGDAIIENLRITKRQMVKKIDSLGTEASLSEIARVQMEYSDRIATLKSDIQVLQDGYGVYKGLVEDGRVEEIMSTFEPEMISIYESMGDGNVGIYPDDNGNFIISTYNLDDPEKPIPDQPVNLTKYKEEVDKRLEKGLTFFDMPEKDDSTLRKKYIDDGINLYKGTGYEFGIYEQIITKKVNQAGNTVPVMGVSNNNGNVSLKPRSVVTTRLDPEKFRKFAETENGKTFIKEYYSSEEKNAVTYDPIKLWVGFGYDINEFSPDNLDKVLVEKFIQAYDPEAVPLYSPTAVLEEEEDILIDPADSYSGPPMAVVTPNNNFSNPLNPFPQP